VKRRLNFGANCDTTHELQRPVLANLIYPFHHFPFIVIICYYLYTHHVHIHICAYIWLPPIYTCTHGHTYRNVCVCGCVISPSPRPVHCRHLLPPICVHIHTHIRTYMSFALLSPIFVHTDVCACVYMCICAYVCMRVCVYVCVISPLCHFRSFS